MPVLTADLVFVFVFASEVYGMMEYYDKIESEHRQRREALQESNSSASHPILEGDVMTMPVRFERCGHKHMI